MIITTQKTSSESVTKFYVDTQYGKNHGQKIHYNLKFTRVSGIQCEVSVWELWRDWRSIELGLAFLFFSVFCFLLSWTSWIPLFLLEVSIYTVVGRWRDLCNCTICMRGLIITGGHSSVRISCSSLPSITDRSKCRGVTCLQRERGG